MGNDNNFDGSIKELSKWRKSLDYDNGDYCYGDGTTKHSLDVAIEIMRKYKKIEQILKDITCDDATLRRIQEVMEDRNN